MHYTSESESEPSPMAIVCMAHTHFHADLSKPRFAVVIPHYFLFFFHAENNAYRDAHAVSILSTSEKTHRKRESKNTELSQVNTHTDDSEWVCGIWRMLDGICSWICQYLMENAQKMVELLSKVMCVVAHFCLKMVSAHIHIAHAHTHTRAQTEHRTFLLFFREAHPHQYTHTHGIFCKTSCNYWYFRQMWNKTRPQQQQIGSNTCSSKDR